MWVQNRITGVWDKDTVVLGQRNGGASFSIYFPDSEKISCSNKQFLRMKKIGGEIPKIDEHRKIPISSPSPLANRVFPSFESHPLRRSEGIWQKSKVKKLDSVLHVRLMKDMAILHFNPEDVAKCNFVFPDEWQQ